MADIERMVQALREADRQGNVEDARRLAQAIRQAQAQEQPTAAPEGGWLRSMTQPVFDAVLDFNQGFLRNIPMPQGARDFLARHGITHAQEREGLLPAAMRGVGDATFWAGGGLAALQARAAAALPRAAQGTPEALRQAQRSIVELSAAAQPAAPGVPAALERAGRQVVDAAARRPGAFWASEIAAGMGAGAGQELGREAADDMEVDGVGRAALETGGALLGGMLPTATPRMLARGATQAYDAALQHVLPFTPAGGRLRAAQQMQRRAADPEAAAQAALDAPEGVTPARATGDEGLMAQEQRILADNPELRAQVQADLAEAQRRTAREIEGIFGEGRSPQAWQHSVMERVAAPGARIEPGDADRMLQQAFDSYGPAYDIARGYRIETQGMGRSLNDAINDPEVFAGEGVRNNVRGWLNSQLKNLARTRAAADGSLTSDDLLQLRQAVRTRSRQLAGTTDADGQQAREVLDRVERRLTSILEEQLPEDVVEQLRQVDRQYRQYKVVEDAMYRGGEVGLDPRRLSDAVRRAAQSPGRYARGADEELRSLALQGRSMDELLRNPALAARVRRGLNDEQLRAVKADYTQTLIQRAIRPDDAGEPVLDGRQFKTLLRQHAESGRALGLTSTEMARLHTLADRLIMMQRRPPEAVARLYEDGPSTVVELISALVGAKGGQRAAGRGLGSSLVLAQFMSRKARDAVEHMTSSQAIKLMTDAATDPKLYAALLTGPTTAVRKQREAAQHLEAWLLGQAAQQAEQVLGGGSEDGDGAFHLPPLRITPDDR